jgi:hypothetical protein
MGTPFLVLGTNAIAAYVLPNRRALARRVEAAWPPTAPR